MNSSGCGVNFRRRRNMSRRVEENKRSSARSKRRSSEEREREREFTVSLHVSIEKPENLTLIHHIMYCTVLHCTLYYTV